METTMITNKPLFLGGKIMTQFPSKSMLLHQQRIGRPQLAKRAWATMRLKAKKDVYGGDFGGAMVDDDMFMLRRRIHEMESSETRREAQRCWMQWEREYYDKYRSDVCALVGSVHWVLVNSRPSAAIAMLVLLMSSVPASVVMVLLTLSGLQH